MFPEYKRTEPVIASDTDHWNKFLSVVSNELYVRNSSYEKYASRAKYRLILHIVHRLRPKNHNISEAGESSVFGWGWDMGRTLCVGPVR